MCNVSARKYPLKEIWEQSANLHKDLLRLRSNQKYESMTTFDEMKTRLQVLHEDHEDISDHQLRQHLNKRERTGH